MKWFQNIYSIEEMRKTYRILLKKYHPDNEGGSLEITQAINRKYDILFSKFMKHEDVENNTYTKKENENWIIEGCMNRRTIQYNEGKQPFTEEAKEKVFGTAKAPEDKTISMMGVSCMGGIAGQIYGG